MSIKVITFDCWGTLYHNKVSLAEERKERILKKLILLGISGISGERINEAMKIVWDHWDAVWKKENRTLTVEDWLTLVLQDLDVQISSADHAVLCEELQQAIFAGLTQPVPRVKEAVLQLKNNYRIGIISDTGIASGRYLRKLFARDNLEVFDLYLFSDEFGMSKPAVQLFSSVLEHFKVEPAEVVHIGDLRHTDIAGARKAGMYSIRYSGIRNDQDEAFAEADYVIDDYRDLPVLIDGIR